MLNLHCLIFRALHCTERGGGLFFKANDNARAFETFTDIICTLAACLTAAIITLCVSLQLRHEQLKPPFPRSTSCSKSIVTKILHWTIFKYSNIQHILKTWSNTLLKFSVQIVKPWVASKRQKDLPPPLKLLSNYNVPSSIGRRFYCATKRRIFTDLQNTFAACDLPATGYTR